MRLTMNNERQRRPVVVVVDDDVDARNTACCQVKENERERKRGRDHGTRQREEGRARTASQIGFIVRLMKAITRGRSSRTACARNCVLRKGLHRDAHPRIEYRVLPAAVAVVVVGWALVEDVARRGTVARQNNVAHRSSTFAN